MYLAVNIIRVRHARNQVYLRTSRVLSYKLVIVRNGLCYLSVHALAVLIVVQNIALSRTDDL